ncbi:putative 3-hydroxyacyl-CoA dehydrogenase-like protein [Eremomyces bilateralis CBS 781.70]|uniref:3-hydroxyacyl-CoA dehydrogenase-like protein n=1 Tax=Eremomyces bilateralis CBS 781.70 TaxID=1392243 RepID=A0A6G1FZN4_9PEZI|nr:putative 3-hydroxyacyl-CoA dehydrogenase-like protein [Eremomyces bilateralis CBS 781.70]KAF1811325.1 putative 3-hydroxyacyl-CoA dehydrogenase-like protein [Eremomyces bilateralis CBS 781.70]
MKIENRTFVVTGGASGLGQATVEHYHQKGGYVSILDLHVEKGEALVAKLGARARFFQCDVTSSESIAAAVKGTTDWVAETKAPVAGVLAGAGVGLPGKIIDAKGEPLSMQRIDFVLNINLRGTLDTIRQFLPTMVANEPLTPDGERGVILMVSSSAATDGQPGQVSYSASKGAVSAMTLPMARDLARYGIRVVTIAPSLFESAMTAMMGDKVRKSLERVMEFPVRQGKPEEFARLCGEATENTMLNGAVIRLDGAMRMPSRM